MRAVNFVSSCVRTAPRRRLTMSSAVSMSTASGAGARGVHASPRASVDMHWRHEPMAPVPGGRDPLIYTPEEAVSDIRSGDRVYVQGIAATPTLLTSALAEHGKQEQLRNVRVYQLHTEGHCPMVDEECEGIFRVKSMFMGANVRKATNEGRADYIPVFLSETPLLFRRKYVDLDHAIVQVSPPDRHGFCSLGTSVDCTRAALQCATCVIGQINKFMPRTHGDGIIHLSNFDRVVYHDDPIYEANPKPLGKIDKRIGELVANTLVEDGATLQMGIGAIPNAMLAALTNHKHLGIHSEMFSDGVLPLVKSGVINGSMKTREAGKLVSTFLIGSQELYDFVDDNPMVDMVDVAYTNNPHVIALQHQMTAINSAIEVDLTGQVVSDSIGTRIYSGVGGQVDFLRGAAVSPGGKAIIALPSRTNKGEPRITPFIKEGAGVVTTRAHVHYVVTEYGVAFLFGKSMAKRCRELISIAHPEDRENLEREARDRGLLNRQPLPLPQTLV